MALVKSDRKVGYFNSYILQRIRNNKNFLCCITGQTGSGKSYSALREGEVLDPDFDIRNVAFTPKQFMDLVNGKVKQLKKGSVLVYDEVQVTMSHLEYQSLQSRLINYVLQTFRYRNFILFMTSPHFKFINASARKLFHSRMETISIDYNKKLCKLKPFLLQINQKDGEVYAKFLRVWKKGLGIVPHKVLRVSLPSQELIEAYEDKRRRFTDELNKGIEMDLERLDQRQKPKPLTKIQEDIVIRLINKETIPQIAEELKIVDRTIYFHLNQAKKKGIEIIPVKRESEVLYYEVKGFERF